MLEVLHIAAVPLPRSAAWERLLSGSGFRQPGTTVRLSLTKGAWPDLDAEGYFEFRTPEKMPARTSFTLRDHIPGERMTLHLAHGALHGSIMDIAAAEASPGETIVTGVISGLGNPAQRTKDARGKYLPTPRQRRAEAALRCFLEAAFLAPEVAEANGA